MSFVCTYLTLERASSLHEQSKLEGVTAAERTALLDEAWALLSSSLPLLVRRMDDNTMLPGRGTAVELTFYKWYRQVKRVVNGVTPHPARTLRLSGLSLGYATTAFAACLMLNCASQSPGLSANELQNAQAFVLRAVDSMQPAARSLGDSTLPEEFALAFRLRRTLNGGPLLDPAFITSLRTKWTAAEMVQMRRARRLLDPELGERFQEIFQDSNTSRRADVAKHGLKECALPLRGKREASAGQHKRCSACRSV